MDREEKNVLIAQACGWKQKSSHFGGHEGIWIHNNGEYTCIPNYFDDLNAIHKAELTLIEADTRTNAPDRVQFRFILGNITGNCKNIIHATAAQRAEAFGQTLKLWNPITQ